MMVCEQMQAGMIVQVLALFWISLLLIYKRSRDAIDQPASIDADPFSVGHQAYSPFPNGSHIFLPPSPCCVPVCAEVTDILSDVIGQEGFAGYAREGEGEVATPYRPVPVQHAIATPFIS
jgi:hypothetical protein